LNPFPTPQNKQACKLFQGCQFLEHYTWQCKLQSMNPNKILWISMLYLGSVI